MWYEEYRLCMQTHTVYICYIVNAVICASFQLIFDRYLWCDTLTVYSKYSLRIACPLAFFFMTKLCQFRQWSKKYQEGIFQGLEFSWMLKNCIIRGKNFSMHARRILKLAKMLIFRSKYSVVPFPLSFGLLLYALFPHDILQLCFLTRSNTALQQSMFLSQVVLCVFVVIVYCCC